MVIKGRTPLSIVPEVWLLLPVYGHFFPSCPVCNAEKLGIIPETLLQNFVPRMCARRFACVNCRAHVRGTRVYMNLHNKKHGTYVDSAYTFFQFCPYPEDGLPIHCCSVSYSCDVSLRKLKLENCLFTGYFGSPFLPEREKEKALKSLNFRALL